MNVHWPSQGCGIGLRPPHYPSIVDQWPSEIDWFEAVSENYMDSGGRPLKILEKIRAHYPVALHGTALSIGSVDPLNEKYLERLKRLADHIEPFLVSDHLCWSGVGGENLHDLLPLPFTEEALAHVVARIQRVQEILGRRFVVENISTYVTYRHSTMTEWEFLTQVARRSGCGLLIDINNIYVNSFNHGFNALEYLKNIPAEHVAQIHLAGHTDMGDFLFDTHNADILDSVWGLYRQALQMWGPVSTLIEWDENIPAFEHMAGECRKAREIYRHFEIAGGDRKIYGLDPSAPKSAAPQDDRLVSRPLDDRSAPRVHDRSIPLAALQEQFKSRVLPQGAAFIKAGSSDGISLREFLNRQGKVEGQERLTIYAGGYTARTQEALSEVYEAVHHVLGDEKFAALSREFALRFPPVDYNLSYAGRELPVFLESAPISQDFPFLADLAKLEWLIWEAFNAFDEKSLTPADIAGVPLEDWDRAQLVFQPSVHLLRSAWPVLDIWRRRKEAPDEARKNLPNGPQLVLVGRRGEQARCELLDENQFRLIEGLLEGKSLGELCETLAEQSGEDNLPVDSWFLAWIQDGLIRGCRFLPKPALAG
jgi:uncharacterized protein (UPF0276 family)